MIIREDWDHAAQPAVSPCLPVLPYNAAFLARAADEVVALPEGSALTEMIADYGVMREQARGVPGGGRGVRRTAIALGSGTRGFSGYRGARRSSSS